MSTPIEEWLEAHGLNEHAAAFVASDIDMEVLPELAEADLEALGLSLGHRERLLRAVAAMAAGEQTTPEERADTATWSREAGERKPVTMLFADITGSAALTESLDAEEAHERLYGAVEEMCEAVERHRGTVCRFMGDGVMAMFGAPVAFEDHAARACTAVLEGHGVVPDVIIEPSRAALWAGGDPALEAAIRQLQ